MMQYSPIRSGKKMKDEEYDIDLDNDEQLHSDDDENIVLLHHGDLHANTHDNIFTEHHAMTPTMQETHSFLKDEESIKKNHIIIKKRSEILRNKIAKHNNKLHLMKARKTNNHESLALQKLTKFMLENEQKEERAILRGETTASMLADEIAHSFMKPLNQRVKLDRRLWSYEDRRKHAQLDSQIEASIFKEEIAKEKEERLIEKGLLKKEIEEKKKLSEKEQLELEKKRREKKIEEMRKRINIDYPISNEPLTSYLNAKKLEDETDEVILHRIFSILDRSKTGRLVRSDITVLAKDRSDVVQEIISRPFLFNLVPLLSSGTSEAYFFKISGNKRFITVKDLEHVVEHGVEKKKKKLSILSYKDNDGETYNIDMDDDGLQSDDDNGENMYGSDHSNNNSNVSDDYEHEDNIVLYDDVILDEDEDFSYNAVKKWVHDRGMGDSMMGDIDEDIEEGEEEVEEEEDDEETTNARKHDQMKNDTTNVNNNNNNVTNKKPQLIGLKTISKLKSKKKKRQKRKKKRPENTFTKEDVEEQQKVLHDRIKALEANLEQAMVERAEFTKHKEKEEEERKAKDKFGDDEILNATTSSFKQRKLNAKVRSLEESIARSYIAWKKLDHVDEMQHSITNDDLNAHEELYKTTTKKILEQNELYDLDSWNDTTIRYKNVEDAVDFDDTALNAMSPPPLSSPSTNGQNDVDTNNDDEEDPISDLDDDDEDFSMEAVKKWTNIMFKKENKWQKKVRKMKMKGLHKVIAAKGDDEPSIQLNTDDNNKEEKVQLNHEKNITANKNLEQEGDVDPALKQRLTAKKKQQHSEDDSAKENKEDETLLDSNEDPDQIIQNISKNLDHNMEFVKEEVEIEHDKHHQHLKDRLKAKKQKKIEDKKRMEKEKIKNQHQIDQAEQEAYDTINEAKHNEEDAIKSKHDQLMEKLKQKKEMKQHAKEKTNKKVDEELRKMKETLMNVDQDAKGDMEHHHDLLQKRLEKKKQQKAEKANQYNNKIDNQIDRIHDAETNAKKKAEDDAKTNHEKLREKLKRKRRQKERELEKQKEDKAKERALANVPPLDLSATTNDTPTKNFIDKESLHFLSLLKQKLHRRQSLEPEDENNIKDNGQNDDDKAMMEQPEDDEPTQINDNMLEEEHYPVNNNDSNDITKANTLANATNRLSLSTAIRLKKLLKRRKDQDDKANRVTTTKQHPSGALTNSKNNNVRLQPLTSYNDYNNNAENNVEIIMPIRFDAKTATNTVFFDKRFIPQATHQTRVTIRFPILENGIYKGTCGVLFAGQELRAKEIIGTTWLQLEDPFQNSWIRLKNPLDANNEWIIEKEFDIVTKALPFTPDPMQQNVIRKTVEQIELLENSYSILEHDTKRVKKGLQVVSKAMKLPDINKNDNVYDIHEALNSASKAIEALELGGEVKERNDVSQAHDDGDEGEEDTILELNNEEEADDFLNDIGGLWMMKKEKKLSKSMPSLMNIDSIPIINEHSRKGISPKRNVHSNISHSASMIEIIPSKQTKIIDIMSKKIKPKDEKVSTVVGKLLNDVCMALNQASNPSTLMYTSSLPMVRIHIGTSNSKNNNYNDNSDNDNDYKNSRVVKDDSQHKYFVRVVMCKDNVTSLNISDIPSMGNIICSAYTDKNGIYKPFNVGPGIYFIQVEDHASLVSSIVSQKILVMRNDELSMDKQIVEVRFF